MNKIYTLLIGSLFTGTCALQADAQSVLHGFGQNSFKQLGTTTSGTNQTTPIVIDSTTQYEWSYVSAETVSNLALKSDGSLWAWGRNVNGQLGDGTKNQIDTPSLIDSGTGIHGRWMQIDMGGTSAYGIREDGSLWAWGSNNSGKLGMGATTPAEVLVPTLIDSGTHSVHGKWKHVDGGLSHATAIREDGSTWAWGSNNNGQLGFGDAVDRHEPTLLDTGTNWGGNFVNINATSHFNVAIKENGSLWAWGWNQYNMVGAQTITDIPVCIDSANAGKWAHISAGYYHTVALKEDSTLWVWGRDNNGQLGLPGSNNVSVPTQIGTEKWLLAEAGQNFTMGIKEDGTFWIWGQNTNGQLGLGTTVNADTLTPLPEFDNLKNPVLSGGLSHTIILERYTPDLAVVVMQYDNVGTVDNESILDVGGTISNLGHIEVASPIVEVRVNDIVVLTDTIGSLAPGASHTVNYSNVWTSNIAGEYKISMNVIAVPNDDKRNNDTLYQMFDFTIGEPNSIENAGTASAIHIYPNPASNVLNLSNAGALKTVVIFDIKGNNVAAVKFSDKLANRALSLSQLTTGVYFIHLIADDGSRAVRKLSLIK
jgi:alpha-tubulin suppressor-like RCC1 family protein